MSSRLLESVILVTLVGFVIRWGIATYPYSGAGKPPMYGDYEAQRHWQEITINLPVEEWYQNSTDNDLMYWGLDYPPLTAYHSYFVGVIASKINPDYVALHKSRGYESYEHKLFMRYSVFLSDLLIYIPAILYLLKSSNADITSLKDSNKLVFVALVLCPSVVLIDYGHFQYNCFSLGLLIAAVAAVTSDWDCLGSFFFSLALNYKQMELYHALPFFCYLLGKSFMDSKSGFQYGFIRVASIGSTVILTFLLIWSPYLQNMDYLRQVVNRVFPIYRGLFEDKVASIWCSLSVVIKFKEIFDNSTMALICLASTAFFCLPSCIDLLLHPTASRFKYSLVNISLVFFLFSFHVHEKSILLVVVPACLLYGSEPFMVMWLSVIAQFSMLPLLDKDGLFIPFVSLTVLTGILYKVAESFCAIKKLPTFLNSFARSDLIGQAHWLSMIAVGVLTLLFKFVAPPARYPDLFSVLIASFSCLHFILFACFFHWRQFSLSRTEQRFRKLKLK